jgi:hypothetical protein
MMMATNRIMLNAQYLLSVAIESLLKLALHSIAE